MVCAVPFLSPLMYYSSSTSGLQTTFPGLCGPRGGEASPPKSTLGVSPDCASAWVWKQSSNFTLPCSYINLKKPWPERKWEKDRWWVRQPSTGNQQLSLMLFGKISSFHYFGVLATKVSWYLFCASCGGLGKDFAWAHLQMWHWDVRENLLVV